MCVCFCEVWESTELLEGFCGASLLRSFCFTYRHIDNLATGSEVCERKHKSDSTRSSLPKQAQVRGILARTYTATTLQHMGIFL
jgi:hypothetical protein